MYRAMTWDYAAYPARFCGPAPAGIAWDLGARLPQASSTQSAEALTFHLDRWDFSSANQSSLIPYYFGRRNPLMRRDFYTTLLRCGIDNLDSYPVILRDYDGVPLPEAYVAVMVVGLIEAVDLEQSHVAVGGFAGGRGKKFERFVIDPARTRGARLFRLAEDPTQVWVDDTVVDQLQAAGLFHLRFWRPSQVASL